MIRMGYYAAAARQAGVREPWVEDAAADIAIRVWLAPESVSWKTVVHRAAIDAAKHYRRGPQFVELTSDVPAPDIAEMAETRERLRQVVGLFGRLTRGQQQAMRRSVSRRLSHIGTKNDNAMDAQTKVARKRLRGWLEAAY